MANERLDSSPENNCQHLSENDGYFFDENWDKRIKAEKRSAKEDDDAKRMRLIDKLFGRKSTDTSSDNEIWEKIERYLQEFKNNPNFFDENGYKRIKAEKRSAKEDDDAKRMRLIDKLFGRKSTDTSSDNEIWEKIERYLQEFKNNPNFFELQDVSQKNFLDKIKNAKDRLEEPLIYKAAAFLLANFEMGGSPYHNLTEYLNRGLWVRALLGRTHYNRFLKDKQNYINQLIDAGGKKDKERIERLQFILARCEMDYIINNIRGSGGKGRVRLSNEFADRLASLSEGLSNRTSVVEKYEKNVYTDFNEAKHEFEKFITSSRIPDALATLERMIALENTDNEVSEARKCFLICMLSGVLDVYGTKSLRKQAYEWGITTSFLPGMLAKETGHSEQVVQLLDDFSEGGFSRHVKTVFHREDLLKGGMNIGDLINEIDSWWSVDMMHKFDQYCKSDFLTKKFSFGSALWRLQKKLASKNV